MGVSDDWAEVLIEGTQGKRRRDARRDAGRDKCVVRLNGEVGEVILGERSLPGGSAAVGKLRIQLDIVRQLVADAGEKALAVQLGIEVSQLAEVRILPVAADHDVAAD